MTLASFLLLHSAKNVIINIDILRSSAPNGFPSSTAHMQQCAQTGIMTKSITDYGILRVLIAI